MKISYSPENAKNGMVPFKLETDNLDLVELGESIAALFEREDDGFGQKEKAEFIKLMMSAGVDISEEDKLKEFLDALEKSSHKLKDAEVLSEDNTITESRESVLKVGAQKPSIIEEGSEDL